MLSFSTSIFISEYVLICSRGINQTLRTDVHKSAVSVRCCVSAACECEAF